MDREEITRNLHYLNIFKGYGDSNKAKVFHIAIEEKLDPNYNQEEVISEFMLKRNLGETEIPNPTVVHPGTESIQSRLSYRVITEILGINMNYSLDDYLQPGNEILRELEFCSNINPIACTRENNWDHVNVVITGYENKTEFLNDSWNGMEEFNGIKLRKEVFSDFFMKIKKRMENENIFVFIEGNDPYFKLQGIIESIFNLNTESEQDRIVHHNHRGNVIFSFYGKKIWCIGHPSNDNFNETDIETVVTFLRNKF